MENLPADHWFESEARFHELFLPSLQTLARNHWTPLRVAEKAANFLAAEPASRILDIGSGIGKFCLAAAYFKPASFFFGIEQRSDLVAMAEAAQKKIGLNNISFKAGNIMDADFSRFDHFYFYNAFYENLATAEKIDQEIAYSIVLYNQYTNFIYRQLLQKPSGTRVATYHGLNDIIPPGYLHAGSDINDMLHYWIRE